MGKIPKSIKASDFRKEVVVTLLGSVALHLFSSDEYQSKIMDIYLYFINHSIYYPKMCNIPQHNVYRNWYLK